MFSRLKRTILTLSIPMWMAGGVAMAQPLDDVALEYQADGVVATIRTTSPVRYLRHFPVNSGSTLEIFFERAPGGDTTEAWVENEKRRSPPSGLIPSFTVTARDLATKPRLVVEFARQASYSVSQGKDQRSLIITIRPDKQARSDVALPYLPTVKPLAKVASPVTKDEANQAENNKAGFDLMTQARKALAAKNDEEAVIVLNRLLLLPPNDYTQDAQEWIGVARERSAQFDKAKSEYDLYLNLYPQSEGVDRVMARLAGLSGKQSGPGIVEETKKKQAARWTTYGGLTSRYYFGKSKIDSTSIFNNVPSTQSLSLTDQSMLITTEDVSGRYISDELDGRLVLRGNNTMNFLATKNNQNRLNAFYGEVKGRKQAYLVRVGRQSSSGGGVSGRFDGLYGSYGDAAGLKVNGVAGRLAEYGDGSKPSFFGASVDIGTVSVYGINQSVDGILDRRAVGAEWRYFKDKNSVFTLVDYDVNFRALNAAQLMGTVGVGDATMNYLLDHRKTPSLSIRNALYGATTSSITVLQQALSASALRDLAMDRTATSNMAQLGVTRKLNAKWQAGGDLRITNTTGTVASGGAIDSLQGFLAENPGRGTEKSVTGNLIGSGLYMPGDIWSFSATLNTSSLVSGNSIYIYNHINHSSGWAIDSSLQIYSHTDQFSAKTTRLSPMVRGTYRIKEQFTVDVDAGFENTKYDGSLVTTKTSRFFGSAGLRWDF